MTKKAKPRQRPPNMLDVARAAGVASITVWRALNAPQSVSSRTRAAIDDAVRKLGYSLDLAARSLVSSRSRLIAALVPNLTDSIFADTVQGMSDRLEQHGYQLLIGHTAYSIEREEAIVRNLLGRRLEAAILTGTLHTQATRDLLRAAQIPVVEMWNLTDDPIDMVVGFSNVEAGRRMTRHLWRLGYRRIAFASRPTLTNDRARDRRRGYEMALAECGADIPAARIVEIESTATEGAALVEALRRADPQLDAIFFSGDMAAIGALLECAARGWKVPQDIAIAGCGDLELAARVSPALTTIRIRGYDIGRRSADLVVRRLAGEAVPTSTIDVGVELIQREST